MVSFVIHWSIELINYLFIYSSLVLHKTESHSVLEICLVRLNLDYLLVYLLDVILESNVAFGSETRAIQRTAPASPITSVCSMHAYFPLIVPSFLSPEISLNSAAVIIFSCNAIDNLYSSTHVGMQPVKRVAFSSGLLLDFWKMVAHDQTGGV